MFKSSYVLLLYCLWSPLFAQTFNLHARHQSSCTQNQVELIKTSLNSENNPSQQHYLMYDHAYFDNSFGFIAGNQETFKADVFFNILDIDPELLNTLHQDLSNSFEHSKIFGLQDTYSLLMQSLFEALRFQENLYALSPEDLQNFTVGEQYYAKLEQHYLTLLDSLRLFHYYLKYDNPDYLTLPVLKDNAITLDTIAQIIHMVRVDGAPFNLSQLQKDLKRLNHVLPLYKNALLELPHQYHTYSLENLKEQLNQDLLVLDQSYQNQAKDYLLFSLIVPNYTALENIKQLKHSLKPNDTVHVFMDAFRVNHMRYLLQKHEFTVISDDCSDNE